MNLMAVDMTAAVDVSALEREIPRILAFGRRTMAEQCVTSAVFVAFKAQQYTPAASIGQIDEELDLVTTPVLSTRGRRKGQPLRSGRKTVATVDRADGGVPLAVLIIQASVMNPFGEESLFNRSTGFRWARMESPFKGRTRAEGAAAMAEAVSRMALARHSSTHFLQAGWTPAIRTGLASPFYRYNPAFGSRAAARALPNSQNTLDPDALGSMVIDLAGDDCVVTVENAVGEPEGRSNLTLAAKHRRAALEYGVPALQRALDEEAAGIAAEVERRLELGWPVAFPELL